MIPVRILIPAVILILITACYREMELPAEIDKVFELRVSPEMQEFIYDSRDTAYSISETGMSFLMDDQALELKEIRTRGKSALRFQRKSFTVFLNVPILLERPDGLETRLLSRFKLISMAMDYTYIENRIAFGILEEQGIFPLFYRYVELKINSETQGIYLLVEDPEQYYLENGSEYILRRGYYHSIDDAEYEPSTHLIPREEYEDRFQEIYSSLTQLQGEDLYMALSERLNLDQYFRKMGIDYLLQNGDYTDEVYLYARIHQDQIRFNIIPWDYDDLFRSVPHEVGITWGTGTLFGKRSYPTHQDVLNEIGDKMIFSIEDDLDYIIAMDPYLYGRYINTLAGMLEKMNTGDFDILFQQTRDELIPFYYNKEVISQSRFDQTETSYQLWEKNMSEKKAFLRERLTEMKQQLKEIQP
ncbi:MAG: CotH kinase family protein [Bacteroidales bacterium]|nr:CotH kinase family protein [Bacteroidales bacterium]